MDSQAILERLYGIRPRKRRRSLLWRIARGVRAVRIAWRRLVFRISRYSMHMVAGSLAFALWIVTHIYYYNQLIMLEQGVQVEWAQLEASRQKRNHIQRNMAALLHYYAKYERKTMGELTEMRAKPGPKDKAEPAGDEQSLQDMLGRLSIVAEQYPNLHLTHTVQQFSEAVVNSESEIATRIMAYNASVNVYSSTTGQFPGLLFATLMGFANYPYYEPEDRSILDYHELKL